MHNKFPVKYNQLHIFRRRHSFEKKVNFVTESEFFSDNIFVCGWEKNKMTCSIMEGQKTEIT